MSIIQMAAKLLMEQLGDSNLDAGTVVSALKGLMPGDGDNIDIAQLMSKMGSGGIMAAASSWLGDGENEPLSIDSVAGLLGQDKIASFASNLGIDSNTASNGLAGMIPELINQNSSGGSLLDSVGNADGIAGFAKKFF